MQPLHQKLTLGFIITTFVMHIFCCGLPLLIGVTNLAAVVGMTGAGAVHPEWFEAIELPALIISGVMLFLGFVLQTISRRVDCRTDGACAHEPCDTKKSLSEKVLLIAAALYVVNLALFFLAH